jgi:hypothetical protein
MNFALRSFEQDVNDLYDILKEGENIFDDNFVTEELVMDTFLAGAKTAYRLLRSRRARVIDVRKGCSPLDEMEKAILEVSTDYVLNEPPVKN